LFLALEEEREYRGEREFAPKKTSKKRLGQSLPKNGQTEKIIECISGTSIINTKKRGGGKREKRKRKGESGSQKGKTETGTAVFAFSQEKKRIPNQKTEGGPGGRETTGGLRGEAALPKERERLTKTRKPNTEEEGYKRRKSSRTRKDFEKRGIARGERRAEK